MSDAVVWMLQPAFVAHYLLLLAISDNKFIYAVSIRAIVDYITVIPV